MGIAALTSISTMSTGKEYTELFAARGLHPSEGVGESQVRIKMRLMEGEGNHSTSVISRLGLVGGGGAVVMV